MKKLMYFLMLMAIVVITSCEKDPDPILEEPTDTTVAPTDTTVSMPKSLTVKGVLAIPDGYTIVYSTLAVGSEDYYNETGELELYKDYESNIKNLELKISGKDVETFYNKEVIVYMDVRMYKANFSIDGKDEVFKKKVILKEDIEVIAEFGF